VFHQNKAHAAGLEAAISDICEYADKLARREWRLFCGAALRADKAGC
jgi:hypothetical protein